MKRVWTILSLAAVLLPLLLVPAQPVRSAVGREALVACRELAFSTEEDFVTHGPVPSDGNPIISDGDLLGPGCAVCARNQDLLRGLDVAVDLGLDAVDILDFDTYLVVFSTEIDSPHKGQFTSGDLLGTNGVIIPNVALLGKFGINYDLGLDALQVIGEHSHILAFFAEADGIGRDRWLENPTMLAGMLSQYDIDIWFSTEGTAPPVESPKFFDGDLLSARTGVIVAANSALLPPDVPAGIPKGGVDFGLDAVATDRQGNQKLILFSTEILYEGESAFTDGDILALGNGIVRKNEDLVSCFEPKARFLGLDALSIPEVPRPACAAAIIRVGGMAAGSIGANGLANGFSTTTPPFEAFDSPFGGWLEIIGLMPSCTECSQFKVEYGAWPSTTTPPTIWVPLNEPFKEWSFIWPGWYIRVDRTPTTDGWLDILCTTTMGGLYMPWNTSGKNGKYSVRLTVKENGGVEHVSAPVVVMLDNTVPDATLTLDVVPVCGDVYAGDVVTGKITGTDAHFYSYRLRYESSLASGLILPVRKYTGIADTGDTNVVFSWDTTGLPACGYQIILEVWDRAIVNNGRSWGEPGYGWRTIKSFYFCLEEGSPPS